MEEAEGGDVEFYRALVGGGVEGAGGGGELVDIDVGREDGGVGGGEDDDFRGSGCRLEAVGKLYLSRMIL